MSLCLVVVGRSAASIRPEMSALMAVNCFLSRSPLASWPTTPTQRGTAPSAAMSAATEAAPPHRDSVSVTFRIGTGASGLMRTASP